MNNDELVIYPESDLWVELTRRMSAQQQGLCDNCGLPAGSDPPCEQQERHAAVLNRRKRLDVKQFRDLGGIQEVNRRLLHPLGLALEVWVEENGIEHFGLGVWDSRDDPEGINFASEGDPEQSKIMQDRARAWDEMLVERSPARQAGLGYVVQPIDKL